MKTVKQKLRELKDNKRTGLSFFLTGGFPDMEYFKDLLLFLDSENFVDFIEVGIPFSDPVADGPVIQESSMRAIKNGATFTKIVEAVGDLKNRIELPVVLMSYLNIVYTDWNEKLSRARDAGFSAIILPDLPVEELDKITGPERKKILPAVLLTTPSGTEDRIEKITAASSPFIYYVSSYGVTGPRNELQKDRLSADIQKVKKITEKPVYCGFGISTARQASYISRYADGIIIGSAVIELINKDREKCFKDIKKFGISIKKAIK
ncbi:MAG: tryptophan synthase subunit alpha [Elusimicrobiota bacterium]